MNLHLIGDVHGKLWEYHNLVETFPMGDQSIQLGDMGIGFKNDRILRTGKAMKDHKFLRGNHDSPAECHAHPNYLSDYGYNAVSRIFHVAGAFSIDYAWRVEGVSWWRDEELSYEELNKVIDLYAATKPEIMLSHECPSSVTRAMFSKLAIGDSYYAAKLDCGNSRTGKALERMFEIYQPRHWYFGHYHWNTELELNTTHFRCLAELSHTTIEVPDIPTLQQPKPVVGFIN